MVGPFGQAARYYNSLGFNVLPISLDSKKPVVKWKAWIDNNQTQDALNYLINNYGNNNIAIITGRVSNICVVDVDSDEGDKELCKYPIPSTVRANTSRGYHLYFRVPDNQLISTSIKILPGVDFKCEGAYVLAPPSNNYTWEKLPDGFKNLPICPEWIIQKLRLRKAGLLPAPQRSVEDHRSRSEWIASVINGVDEGLRNESCAKYAGYLLSMGSPEDECLTELLEWNLKNRPPMSENEIISIFNSINKREKIKIYSNAEPISLETAKDKILQYLYFEDSDIIDIVLAAAISYTYESGPVWIILVGPPSSGKTEILRSIKGYKDTIFIESITDRTLFSGRPNAYGILEKNNSPFSLLINKDFGSILSKPSGEKGLILQQLRGIYDSEYHDATGSGKAPIEWHNRLNFISACTQDIESNSNQEILSDLGERFIYYKIKPENDETARFKAKRIMQCDTSDRNVRYIVSKNMLGVLKAYDGFDGTHIKIPENIANTLIDLCTIAVKARTRIKRSGFNKKVIEYHTSPECAIRMLKSIKGLLIGLTTIRGKKESDIEDLKTIARVILDSIPTYKKIILKIIIKKGYFGIKNCNINENTIHLILEDFAIVGILDKELFGNDSFQYKFTPAVQSAINNCSVYLA